MATQDHVRYVECLIQYEFKTQDWATTALTAAGAEEFNHHGNRMCARYGRLLIEFYILNNAHSAGVSPATTSDYTTEALRKTRHAAVAKEKGIDACIKCCPRQGSNPPTDTTLSNAICAIIGAAWLDSQIVSAPFKVIDALGLGESQLLSVQDSADPQHIIIPEAPFINQEVSWPIESTAIDQDSNALEFLLTPWLLPTVDEPSPISAAVEPLMLQLATSTLEPQNTSSSEHWQTYLEDHLDGHDPLDVASPQELHPFSPAMSSPVYFDTPPQETTGTNSARSSHDNIDFNPEDDTASVGARGDQGLATGSAATKDLQHATDLVQQSNSRKRKAAKTEKFGKRAKPQQEQTSRCDSAILPVESYIQMERDKCERLGIPYDEQNYLPPSMAQWISALDKDDERAAVSMISTAIGSSESIALLQHIVIESRAKGRQTKPAEELPFADRVREIQKLGGQTAFIEFLRRCHVWKLYRDVSQDIRSPQSAFVIVTSENMKTPRVRRAGNPKNCRDSQITKAMLRGLALELDHDSREYKRQYRYHTKLRRLGQRLELLTTTFGFGVLGLIPFQDPFESGISDETILLPSDNTFQDCVEVVNKAQGDTIRKFGLAIEGVVLSIFHGTLSGLSTFPIENVERVQILSQPKGSDELLKLLSSAL